MFRKFNIFNVIRSSVSSKSSGIEPGPSHQLRDWVHKPELEDHVVKRMFPVRNLRNVKIALVRTGCRNRPFFTIDKPGFEQIGSWDPIPNNSCEQLVAINFSRLFYWLGRGAIPTLKIKELIGLSGFLPVHPSSYLKAYRIRQRIYENEGKDVEKNIIWYGSKKLPEGFVKRGL